MREQIARIDAGRKPDDLQILGFLRNQIGTAQTRDGADVAAARTFTEAIEVDARTVPAYLNLGDVRAQQGNLSAAVAAWERLVDTVPERAYLAFERLERAYQTLGTPKRFIDLCHRLIEESPLDWRTRLALSRHLSSAGDHRAAFDLLLDALTQHPHGPLVITSAAVRSSRFGDVLMCRRRSPSVMMPIRRVPSSTTHVMPSPLRDIS